MNYKPVIPPFLQPGDTVAVVSPSGLAEPGHIGHAEAVIAGWGLNVIRGEHSLAVSNTFAGTDLQRASDLQRAISDPLVKAIFCSRGGYGLSRIIDRIDFSPLKRTPKWIIGYSDITVMHMWVASLFGMATIHGEMLLNYGNPSKSSRSVKGVRDLLFGIKPVYSWKGEVLRSAPAEGVVTGGNLALLCSLAGTAGRPETDGRILFIEDTGEYWYSVDRMLQSLRLAGMLSNLSALLVGDFSDMRDTAVPFGYDINEIVADVTSGYSYPVYFGFPAGHCNDNVAFFLGMKARLTASGSSLGMGYVV